MRRAVNENPVVQAALVGLMLVAFGFLLFTRILGGEEPAPEPTATTTPAGTASAAPTATGEVAAPGAAVPADPAAPVEPAAPGGTTGEFSAGKGLPGDVVKAYEDGKAIALLITRACGVGPIGAEGGPCKGRWRQSGLDDKGVKIALELLRARSDVAVFVTAVKDIARYSQITLGADVDRTPALVMIQPKKVSGDVPEASVSYGYRGPGSVNQAIDDALYDGRQNVPYYPE